MNKATPLISIIVPVYNVGHYIERCCKSLFSQTYENIEYVFVNDCTQDNSLAIIDSLLTQDSNKKKNIKIINHKENGGLAKTRNTGISYASGEYITFVDSDDEIPINAIELFVSSLYATSSVPDIIIADHSINTIKESEDFNNINICDKCELLKKIITKRERTNIWGILYKANLFKNIKWWEGLDFGEDYATLPRLVNEAEYIIKSHFYAYIYHTDNQNSYMRSIRKKSAEQLYEVLYNLDDFFINSGILSKIIMTEGKLRSKSHLLQGCCNNNETFQFVCDWFNNESLTDLKLNFKEQLILKLASKRKYGLLRAIIKVRSLFKFM